ncbi:adenylyl-sulfate kinase [candidate division KSB1 bacterium]|nr:adenylyl-sulfate kinase [candidate division KSB1 bacterium]
MVSSRACTIWFTGLSGAGKTAITNALVPLLKARGCKVEVLDGDIVRANLSKGLGFSKEDCDIKIRRLGFVCQLLTRHGVFAIAAAISPDKTGRDENRTLIKDFVEVYVKASLETCIQRDVKGLYKNVLAGESRKFTGLSDPYEPPDNPEVICDTERETPSAGAQKIVRKLEQLDYLVPLAGAAENGDGEYIDDDEELVRQRLEALGYL